MIWKIVQLLLIPVALVITAFVLVALDVDPLFTELALGATLVSLIGIGGYQVYTTRDLRG